MPSSRMPSHSPQSTDAHSTSPSAVWENIQSKDNMEGAKRSIEWYIETYGKDNFFLEIQNHGLPEEAAMK